jgi:hypothetical protein
MNIKHFLSVGAAAAIVALASQASAGVNLVANGDFSGGNSGFSSDYNYVAPTATAPACCSGQWAETTYSVGPDAHNNHPLWDSVSAPSGSGDYLIVNGATTAGKKVWYETVTAAANTWYNFSAQASGIYPASPATLVFSIGGSQVGSTLDLSSTVPDWLTFSSGWYSGAGGSVMLAIVDTNLAAGGNDFGVDNISLATPEPSTWAMMGLGFAGLAFAGYRARRTPVAAAV